MRTVRDIEALLDELDIRVADELEDQDMDFKQWDTVSMDKSVRLVVQMAICMANGGGGTVVFGVADKISGRASAILGVPPEVDVNRLKKAVYDQTDPKIMPVFEDIRVPEGTGRLLVMQIFPGMPPYTDTGGRGTVRIGKDCQPLTGTLRRKIAVETGETDFTAEIVAADLGQIMSAAAIECLRDLAREENAPEDLLRMEPSQLLRALGVLPHGSVTKAAVLLCGSEDAIREYVPGHYRLFLRMRSDTEYDIREDRVTALPISIARCEELLQPLNPITTVERGMYHFEYQTYPQVAFREALMNAFSHADYRIAGPVMVKLYADCLTISNNGGFIGGISPANILHHQPAARNPLLVEALTRLRLVNRSNLGVTRMFTAFLLEGKRPPIIQEIGESVAVTFLRSELDEDFRRLMAEIDPPPLDVDELRALLFLTRAPLADVTEVAEQCNRSLAGTRDLLARLSERGLAQTADKNRDSLWRIASTIRQRFPDLESDLDARKLLLELLQAHADTGLPMRRIVEESGLARSTVKRLLEQLKAENLVRLTGAGRSAKWEITQ